MDCKVRIYVLLYIFLKVVINVEIDDKATIVEDHQYTNGPPIYKGPPRNIKSNAQVAKHAKSLLQLTTPMSNLLTPF
jgi:hypothetical protein